MLAIAFLSSGVRLREDDPRRTRSHNGVGRPQALFLREREGQRFFAWKRERAKARDPTGRGGAQRVIRPLPCFSLLLSFRVFALSRFRAKESLVAGQPNRIIGRTLARNT